MVSKNQSGTCVKLIQEIGRRKVEQLIYTAFLLGFSAASEKRSIDHPDNFLEIRNTIDLLDYSPKKAVAKS